MDATVSAVLLRVARFCDGCVMSETERCIIQGKETNNCCLHCIEEVLVVDHECLECHLEYVAFRHPEIVITQVLQLYRFLLIEMRRLQRHDVCHAAECRASANWLDNC